MRRGIFFGLALTGAVVLSDLVLYDMLIVPRLPNWQSIPTGWWTLLASPAVITIMVAGIMTTGWTEILWLSAAAAVSSTMYEAWAANSHMPGHLKSLAVESPRAFWLIGPATELFGVAALVGCAHQLARWCHRRF